MKVTVVTDAQGNKVASVLEQVAAAKDVDPNAPSARLLPQPGQVFSEIEVPDDYGRLSPDELHEKLRKHLSGSAPKA